MRSRFRSLSTFFGVTVALAGCLQAPPTASVDSALALPAPALGYVVHLLADGAGRSGTLDLAGRATVAMTVENPQEQPCLAAAYPPGTDPLLDGSTRLHWGKPVPPFLYPLRGNESFLAEGRVHLAWWCAPGANATVVVGPGGEPRAFAGIVDPRATLTIVPVEPEVEEVGPAQSRIRYRVEVPLPNARIATVGVEASERGRAAYAGVHESWVFDVFPEGEEPRSRPPSSTSGHSVRGGGQGYLERQPPVLEPENYRFIREVDVTAPGVREESWTVFVLTLPAD